MTMTTSVSKSGTNLPIPSRISYGILIDPDSFFLNLDAPACGHLIRREFAPHALPSLIEAIFTSKDVDDTIRSLLRDDAQTFVDVIDEARSTFAYRRESIN